MRRFVFLLALLLGLLTPAFARTVQKCGSFTVTVDEVKGEYGSQEVASLRGLAGVIVKLEESQAGMQWCQDITGDKTPEVLLYTYSGGAHCCTEHYLYTLTNPARELLHAYSGNIDEVVPKQLDGKGPLELLSYDNRFAYAYGLCFACSPFLPIVYAYRDGLYVDDSRNFPGLISAHSAVQGRPKDGAELLQGVASLMALGRDADISNYIRLASPKLQDWMNSYLPDVRQDMATYGLLDWPRRAGYRDEDVFYTRVAGALTGPGKREVLAYTWKKGAKTVELRAFGPVGSRIVAGPALVTFPTTASRENFKLYPEFQVKRATGQMDVLVRDERSGGIQYIPYRFTPTSGSVLTDDALSVFARLLGGLVTLAKHNETITESSTKRTAAQLAELSRRADAAAQRAQPWLNLSDLGVKAHDLAHFTTHAVEFQQDGADSARAIATVDVGLASSAQNGFVPSDRYLLSANLTRAGGSWKVQDWTLDQITEDPPVE